MGTSSEEMNFNRLNPSLLQALRDDVLRASVDFANNVGKMQDLTVRVIFYQEFSQSLDKLFQATGIDATYATKLFGGKSQYHLNYAGYKRDFDTAPLMKWFAMTSSQIEKAIVIHNWG